MKSYPRAVRQLLFSTLVFVMARSVGMPYLAIYLSERLGLSPEALGWLLGGSVFVATVFGLYAGHLADRHSKPRLLLAASLLMALACVAATLSSVLLLVFAALCCMEAAVSLQKIAVKAMLADCLEPARRARAFALNYTLTNIAFSLGPLLGAWAFGLAHAAPLWFSAAFAMAASRVLDAGGLRDRAGTSGSAQTGHATQPPRTSAAGGPAAGFRQTLNDLRRDRQLILLTLAGVLSAFVFGRFVTGYLSQYLIQTQGSDGAARTMPAILFTNAAVVLLLQYPLGRRIAAPHLFRWMSVGLAFYVLGLLGFMHAQDLLGWVLATAAFTVGEVITVPCDYLFIDRIAPADKRGSYYGAQGLSVFGAALSPVVCGHLLASHPPALMFGVLIAAALASAGFYHRGSVPTAARRYA